MSAADGAAPLTVAEARSLFAGLSDSSILLLAVSGGPDSTALLWLAARWRKGLRRGPRLVAATVDHGLRPRSAAEARAVATFARALGVTHCTLSWSGRKPVSGLQAAARKARYRLLAEAARKAGARHVLTAHTLDDQAETVLLRLAHGSGPSGLAAMTRMAPLPAGEPGAIALVRPLLDVSKARLVATLARAGIPHVDDPSNRDPRFARARLRAAMPALAREGLTPHRLARLAQRVRRVEATVEMAVDAAQAALAPGPWSERGPIAMAADRFAGLPDEVALRLLGRAIARVGDEGPVELGKLEVLCDSLQDNLGSADGSMRFRRTLAGALVMRHRGQISVERAPARRAAPKRP